VTKKWGLNAGNNYSKKYTNSASKKMLGQKSSQNIAKKHFLYSHDYRDQKMGGEKRAKQF